jgi:hypothetical protein
MRLEYKIMREVLTVRMEDFPNRRLRKTKKPASVNLGPGGGGIKSGRNLLEDSAMDGKD